MEYLVIFLPLIGSIITYFGKGLGNLFSQIFSCFMVVISAVMLKDVEFNKGVKIDD